MRELTANEVEFIGGGDFWGGLKEDFGQLGQEIENIWQGFMSGGSSSGSLPTAPNVPTLEQLCMQNGGSFTYANGTLTLKGLSELGGGTAQFSGNILNCSK